MNKQKVTKLDKLFDDNNIDFYASDYYYDDNMNDINDFDDLINFLDEKNALQVEVIYYNKAMSYLSEHDPALQHTLELASDLGFELSKLNSETLASILATDNLRNDINDLSDDINDILN
tara:strand:+ start:2050 stop:2406 length:357 start_codon:yes stop_codon:yes gene_type:complete